MWNGDVSDLIRPVRSEPEIRVLWHTLIAGELHTQAQKQQLQSSSVFVCPELWEHADCKNGLEMFGFGNWTLVFFSFFFPWKPQSSVGRFFDLGKHLWFRFFDFDKILRFEGFFFFNFWKLKKPLISVFFSKTLPNQKNLWFQFLYKKNSIKRTSSFIQVFPPKKIKRTGGSHERTDKHPAVWGRFFDPVLWIFLEP